MSKRKRKIIFFFFLFNFFFLGTLLLLYSFGYRIDFEKRKITQTGGIFVKAIPKGVSVYLNGNFIKKTDFIFGSALIENLLPRKYKIRIEKASYFPWEKELEVREKMVTEIKNLVLFPENLKFSPISKNIEDFWYSPDGKKIILKEKEEDGFSLKFLSLEKNVKSHLVSGKEFLGEKDVFLDLQFKDANEVEILVSTQEKRKVFSLNLTKTSFQLIEKEEKKIPENVFCYLKQGGDFYFFDRDGNFYLANNKFEKLGKKNEEPLKTGGEERCFLKMFKNFFLLQLGDKLYFLNLENKNFEKIIEGVEDFLTSPDSQKTAIFLKSEIWLFFEDGKKVFLNRFASKISHFFWLNSDYLLFVVDKKIKVSEIDTRDKVNTFEIRDFSGEKLFFNFFDKRIYFLENNNFYQSDPLELF